MNAPKDTLRAKNIVTTATKVVVPLAVTVLLLVWFFHKVNFKQVMAIIREGVDYRYIFVMMGLTVLSHVIRGVRWGIQLRAVGIPRISVTGESVSIFGAYALNIVFPFLGEAWRCLYISKRENAKLSTVVGTDIGDRASDGIMIGLIILLSLYVAHPEMMRFADHYRLGETLEHMADSGTLWLSLVALLALLAVLDRAFRHTKFVQGINASLMRIWVGFKVLFHLKQTGAYLLLTVGIWVCYFLETYVVFFAFPFTRELITQPGMCWGLVPGLVVFVFGSCSMIVPSNGGLGPWNIAVAFALTLFGISETDGAAFSLVYWSFQSLMLIACGIFSAIYISTYRRRHREL